MQQITASLKQIFNLVFIRLNSLLVLETCFVRNQNTVTPFAILSGLNVFLSNRYEGESYPRDWNGLSNWGVGRGGSVGRLKFKVLHTVGG